MSGSCAGERAARAGDAAPLRVARLDAAQRLLHQLPQGPGYLLLFLVLLLLLLLLLCAAILWLLLLLHYRFE